LLLIPAQAFILTAGDVTADTAVTIDAGVTADNAATTDIVLLELIPL